MRHSIVDQGNSRQSIELQSKKVEAGHGSTFLQKERNGRSRLAETILIVDGAGQCSSRIFICRISNFLDPVR